MRFFDYVFYKMKWWNSKIVLDFTPFLSSIIIIAVFQGFNVLVIYNFIKYYFGLYLNILENYYLAIPIIFFILNLLYYRSPIKQNKIDKWAKELDNRTKQRYNISAILYFLFSLLLLIWIGYKLRIMNMK